MFTGLRKQARFKRQKKHIQCRALLAHNPLRLLSCKSVASYDQAAAHCALGEGKQQPVVEVGNLEEFNRSDAMEQ